MKAQTSRTPEKIGITEQQAPVIVKIGGGDTITDIADTIILKLDSPDMPFIEQISDPSGKTWQQAISTLTGRIHELSLRDGNLKNAYCSVVPQPDVLTSLEITFGNEQLVLSEVPAGDKCQLQVQAVGTSFTVSEPDFGKEKEWYASKANFTDTNVSLIFSQKPSAGGDEIFKFEYAFNNSDIHFSLAFHVPLSQ